MEIVCFDEVESTMDVARELASEGRELCVLARIQTAGRGRERRTWESVPGNFHATFVLQAKDEINLSGLSLAIGVVLVEILQEMGAALFLKWPNDVLTEKDKKVAGILVEVSSRTVLIGIGVNLRASPPQVLESSSILESFGLLLEPLEFAELLKPHLLSAWSSFQVNGSAAFRERWLNRGAWIGSELAVDLGMQEVAGTFVGVSAQGGMLLEVEGKVREIVSGRIIRRSLRLQ